MIAIILVLLVLCGAPEALVALRYSVPGVPMPPQARSFRSVIYGRT